jgi:hypothetical protein
MNKITVSQLAAELNIKPRSVWYWITALGIEGERVGVMRMMLLSEADAQNIKDHCIKYQDGNDTVSVAMLMKELSLSKQGVWDVVRKTTIRSNSRKGSQTRFSQAEAAVIRSIAHERKNNR